MYPSTSFPDYSSGRPAVYTLIQASWGYLFSRIARVNAFFDSLLCLYLVVGYGTVVFMVMSCSLSVCGGGPRCGVVTCTSVGYCSIRHYSCLVSLMMLLLFNLPELIFVVRVCIRCFWLDKENSDSKPGKVVSLSADKFHLGEGENSDSKLTAKEGKLKENLANCKL